MATYTVGDIVLVKTGRIREPAGIVFASDMRNYCGTHVTISKTYVNPNGEPRCTIQEDNGRWVWCDEFFELCDTSKVPYEYW
jgi:hypothetical protein